MKKLICNPTSNRLNVQFAGYSTVEISINNLIGELIMEKKGVVSGQNIDVSVLPKGVYFLIMRNEKGVVNKKFIKE